jgi:NADPH2:quinone reductase
MKAVIVESFGGPEVLRLVDREPPAAGPGEVVVEVKAVNVNRADILMRTGKFHGVKQPPFTPGLGAAGQVHEVGAGVTRFKQGDRVLTFGDQLSSYAQLVHISESRLVPIPEGVDWAQAATLPTAGLTAFFCLFRLAQLREGETVLIHAAASGVGHAAVQLARHSGARVIATAGSDRKLDWARELGAWQGINYSRENVVERVMALTDGAGVDVAIDAVGGPAFRWSLQALKQFGRCVALANVTTEDTVMNTRDFYPKNAVIHGFQLPRRMAAGYDPRGDLADLLERIRQGQLRPHVAHRFPLEQVAEAHRALESRQTLGHVVLLPVPDHS